MSIDDIMTREALAPEVPDYDEQGNAAIAAGHATPFAINPPPQDEGEVTQRAARAPRPGARRAAPAKPHDGPELNGACRLEPPDEPPPDIAARIADEERAGLANNSDMGNAARFVEQHGNAARFVYFGTQGDGRWYAYNGKHWEPNPALAQRRAQETARQLKIDADARLARAGAMTFSDPKSPKALAAHKAVEAAESAVKWATRSQNASSLAAMLSTAACDLAAKPDEFDCDPWALNVANGTLDLRSGVLRAHRREDMISKLSPVAYSPEATSPTWDRFLAEVQPNHEIRAFLQRLAGYSMTGLTREHVLAINYGSGRNGKGVFMNSVLHVAGSYGVAIAPELLMIKRGETHPTGVTDLFGARLASSQETKEGEALDVATVKALTSEDAIRARRMREDFWQFAPSHQLWLSTNHKPRISETKNAIWRRVLLVPWEVTIEEARVDRNLEGKLRLEASGVLAWFVEGAREYQRIGLSPPDIVVAAGEAYRAQQDTLGAFLQERCVLEPSAKITRGALVKLYRDWCVAVGEDEESTLTASVLAEKIREHGCEDGKMRGASGASERAWKGIRAKTLQERALDGAAETAEQPN